MYNRPPSPLLPFYFVQCPGYVDLKVLKDRYGIDPSKHTGEEFLYLSGKKLYHGELNSMACRLLTDFRKYGNIIYIYIHSFLVLINA